MCGILGRLCGSKQFPTLQPLQPALARLQHRGPDDQGELRVALPAGCLDLAHRRLAILDLTPAGHQPMQSPDGHYVIVFNGEIYNFLELRQTLAAQGHVFHTQSDTEVLLAAWAYWGVACLPQLRGMFAFAVLDRQRQTLTCVRDAFGIKPVYVAADAQGFCFASELPALAALLPSAPMPDQQWLLDYLLGGSYDSGARTAFEGVKALLPGHLMEFDCGRPWSSASISEPRRWWWPPLQERTDLSFAEAADELRQRLLANVRLHLRSDVPLAAALSGGIDSSAVVCAMRQLEPDLELHTFTFTAPCSSIDEGPWAQRINQATGALGHPMQVRPDELLRDLPSLIAAQGEPFGSTSIYAQYRVFQAAREAGITVMLEGQGADELLAGYGGYPVARLSSLLQQGDAAGVLRFVQGWSQGPGRGRRRAALSLAAALLPPALRDQALASLRRFQQPSWLNRNWLRSSGLSPDFPLPSGLPPREAADPVPAGRQLVGALRHTLLGGNLQRLLRHGDRNSMQWSIESRVPFLTHDLADFLLGLPEAYLVSPQGESKHLLRAALRGLVPDAVLDRRDKIGFATPEPLWLKALGPLALQWCDACIAVPFLDPAAVRRTFERELFGDVTPKASTWRLLNLCGWLAWRQTL
jgi:asparagine synthase (glutamine-hydrolysing)